MSMTVNLRKIILDYDYVEPKHSNFSVHVFGVI